MSGLAKKFVVIENPFDETASAQSDEPVIAAEVALAVDEDAVETGEVTDIADIADDNAGDNVEDDAVEGSAAEDSAESGDAEDDADIADDDDDAGAPETAAEAEPVAEATPADPAQRPDEYRLLEALLFASREPLDEATLAKRLPQGVPVRDALRGLQADYATRGVNLVRIGRKWSFRTAGDLSWLMTKNVVQTRKLSRAAIETLAIIAYHQPVTRAEVEEIRGVAAAKGTLDVLLETGWVKPRGRRKVPGRPITYGTSDEFLSHFGLETVEDLPGLDELRGAGLLDGRLPPGFAIPVPSDDDALRDDEEPLEPGDLLDFGLAPPAERVEEG